jgi:enoyl-CoA hydratase
MGGHWPKQFGGKEWPPLKALFHANFDAGVAYECLSNLTDDHQEAVHAFRERCRPVFRGT